MYSHIGYYQGISTTSPFLSRLGILVLDVARKCRLSRVSLRVRGSGSLRELLHHGARGEQFPRARPSRRSPPACDSRSRRSPPPPRLGRVSSPPPPPSLP